MATGHGAFELNAARFCVFGGGNGWGRRIAESQRESGSTVSIVEKDTPAEHRTALVAGCDVVFLAVPDDAIDALLRDIAPLLAGRRLIDCATNKTGFSARLRELADSGISVCSTHPMAASGGALRGQNALIMPLGAGAGPAEACARAIYGRLGMHCQALPFAQHTALMAIVQMLPHLLQRLCIEALGHGLTAQQIAIGDLHGLASANYLLAELGLGRVAAQRAEVSAGIIATALHEASGQELMDALRQSLQHIRQAGHSREALAALFTTGTQRLDPDGAWRGAMAEKSEAALIRLGNLRSRALTIEAPNRIGMLRDILTVLANHRIDMTALDSQLFSTAEGGGRVHFDIAISNGQVPYDALTRELAAIGARFVRVSGQDAPAQ